MSLATRFGRGTTAWVGGIAGSSNGGSGTTRSVSPSQEAPATAAP